jgi:hypothetical protein
MLKLRLFDFCPPAGKAAAWKELFAGIPEDSTNEGCIKGLSDHEPSTS